VAGVQTAMKAIGCETASATAYFAGNTRDAVMVRPSLHSHLFALLLTQWY